MKKNTLLQELHKLNELFWQVPTQSPTGDNPSERVLEQMESLLMNYLKNHPRDTNMWLKLTMVEFTPPWEDYDRIEKHITRILEYDENNIQGLLILAYAQRAYRGDVSDDLFAHLQRCCNIVTDRELLSMLYLAMAWYYSWYSLRDEKKYELSLLQSIDYCSAHVYNYELLGRLYLKTGRQIEGKKMIRYALANVRKIYGENYFSLDVTDINEFFDQCFRGTHITQPNLESIHELLD